MKKDVIFYFISKVFIGVFGLLIINLYSTFLSPESYGEYSLAAGFITVLMSIFIGWIGSSALRYYDEYKENKKLFFTNVFYYLICMFLVMFIIIILASFISKTIPIKKYLGLVILLNVSYCLQDVFEKVLRAAGKTGLYTIASILQSFLSVGIFYFLAVVIKLDTPSIFLSSSLSKLVFVFIAFISLGFIQNIRFTKVDKDLLKKFLKYGIPMIGVWGVGWILNYCDRYIIALFNSTSDVGIYDMSYKISENTINIMISSFTLAIFPALIKMWNEGDREKVEQKITEVLKYYFMLTIPAVLGLCLVVDNIYIDFIDTRYMSGKYVIMIVSLGCLFNGLNNIFNKIWQLNEKTKNILYIMIASVIINIILNILLIPKFGINAAALTTLISYIFTTIVTYLFVKKEFKLCIDFKSLFKTIIACIIMGAFIVLFNKYVASTIMLLVEIFISMLLYFVVNILLKNINLKDIRRR